MATRKTTTTSPVVTTTLDPRVFTFKVNKALLAQALHVYTDNSHQHTHKVKSRGEINATNHKVYKQKGTGNARHGAKSAPIYVGGGVAHGPRGLVANRLKLNRRMKAIALASILSAYAADSRVQVVDVSKITESNTKKAKAIFTAPKSLIVHAHEDVALTRSISNLSASSIESVKLNPLNVSLAKHLYLTPKAHDLLVEKLVPLLTSKKSHA